MANSVDPDQTVPALGAFWYGSILSAKACLSKYLGYKK